MGPAAVSGVSLPENERFYTGDGITYSFEVGSPHGQLYLLGTAGTAYYILVNPDSSLDPILTIRDSTGTSVVRLDDQSRGMAELLRFVPETSDSYELTVSPFEDRSGGGLLSVFEEKGPFVTTLLQEEALVEADDVNRYEFELAAAQPLLISVEAIEDFDPVFEVYGPTGFLLNRDKNPAGEPELFLLIPEREGKYVLTVFGYRFSEGNYRINVKAFLDEN